MKRLAEMFRQTEFSFILFILCLVLFNRHFFGMSDIKVTYAYLFSAWFTIIFLLFLIGRSLKSPEVIEPEILHTILSNNESSLILFTLCMILFNLFNFIFEEVYVIYRYLFIVWAIVIFLLFLISRSLNIVSSSDEETDRDTEGKKVNV
ncbi:MAG: hypothetical protein GY795_07855 [Desulfobacterales bacterium]|nr:hypothetical protein [Desulfobacterales bacterium]